MARGVARNRGLQAGRSPGPTPRGLLLVEPLGAHTWRALADGGVPVAARWLAAATGRPDEPADPRVVAATWPAWADDPTLAGFATPSPALVPVLGTARTGSALWLLSELDDGVPLRRLLALARLTPLQAAAVLDTVLVALGALHERGFWHGRVHASNVHVSPTGQVRVSDWAPARLTPGPLDGHRRADLAAAMRLAGELATATRLPQYRPGSRHAVLQGAIEHCAVGSLVESVEPWPELLDAGESARAEAELATIVQALRRSRRPHATAAHVPAPRQPSEPTTTRARPPDPAAPAVPAGPPAPPVPLVSAGPPLLRPATRRRTPPLVLAVATLALLGTAVVAEVGLLGPDIRASWQRLTDAPTDDGHDPRTVVAGPKVPTLAPAATGAITRVAARPLRRCVPGQVCDLRVMVQVWPDDTRRIPVAWSIAVVDTCTGARTLHPGGAAKVPTGADRVDGLTHVLLPQGEALAVVAVTDEPARAASPPLPVPADAGPC